MQGLQKPASLRHFQESFANKTHARYSIPSLVFLLMLGTYISTMVLDTTVTKGKNELLNKTIEFPLNCSSGNLTKTCPANYYPPDFRIINEGLPSKSPTCPHYFHWIHEDLRPWRETGITREAVERANKTANFRLVILNGRAYVETYEKGFQTRDVFTMWGILQLLRRYPGKVPDLELMFDCVDWPVIQSSDYPGPNVTGAPPLFRYCADDKTLDIVFPDWSFWGWAEINIKPWEHLLNDLREGNKRIEWKERAPYAFWKGNPDVAEKRMELLKCNVSENQDWNARIYAQNWAKESEQGYKQSDLASQCIHRYKIYIEGSAWSVSQKYILACDSVSLFIKPHYYDFFTRSLMPLNHYWPIKEEDTCRSIKFAVDWGNKHKRKAMAIGKAGSTLVLEELRMDYVYDYMFHLLNEYAKLLRYKPTVPEGAVELCSETMACPAEGREKEFMLESMEQGPSDVNPCIMHPPFNPSDLDSFQRRKEDLIKQVELWETTYWQNQNKQTQGGST